MWILHYRATMATSLVLPLQHLAGSRIVTSLFSHFEMEKNIERRENRLAIRSRVLEAIPSLTSSTPLREILETFIDPLINEIEDCLLTFKLAEQGMFHAVPAVLVIIPRFWLSDGTIDREKVARVFVKNENVRPMDRFISACAYCLFDDALEIWSTLYNTEKGYIKHKAQTAKFWAEWMESSSTKNWESFLEWSLGTPLWHTNVYLLKNALKTMSRAEISQYLLKTVISNKISDDVMRLCISVLSKDEQEQIFRESPVNVFNCMLYWPLRPIFFVVANDVWPHLTEESFCLVLGMILKKIRYLGRVTKEFLDIVKELWKQCPYNFRNAVKRDRDLFNQLQFFLDLGESQEFPKWNLSLLPDRMELTELEELRISNDKGHAQNDAGEHIRGRNDCSKSGKRCGHFLEIPFKFPNATQDR